MQHVLFAAACEARLLPAVWDYIDGQLASLFGLDQSKYEWAVREHEYQQWKETSLQNGRPAGEGPSAQQGSSSQVSDVPAHLLQTNTPYVYDKALRHTLLSQPV